MNRLWVILLFIGMLSAQKLLDWSFRDYSKNKLTLKNNNVDFVIKQKDKIKLVKKNGDFIEGRFITYEDKEIYVFGIAHIGDYRNYSSKFYIFNIDDLDFIQMGFGNKSIKFGLGYGSLIAVPSYLWYKTWEKDARGGGDAGWGLLLPISLGVIGTPVFSIIGLIEGSIVPSQFKKPMVLRNGEWEIVE
jgi:hypothetical protein